MQLSATKCQQSGQFWGQNKSWGQFNGRSSLWCLGPSKSWIHPWEALEAQLLVFWGYEVVQNIWGQSTVLWGQLEILVGPPCFCLHPIIICTWQRLDSVCVLPLYVNSRVRHKISNQSLNVLIEHPRFTSAKDNLLHKKTKKDHNKHPKAVVAAIGHCHILSWEMSWGNTFAVKSSNLSSSTASIIRIEHVWKLPHSKQPGMTVFQTQDIQWYIPVVTSQWKYPMCIRCLLVLWSESPCIIIVLNKVSWYKNSSEVLVRVSRVWSKALVSVKAVSHGDHPWGFTYIHIDGSLWSGSSAVHDNSDHEDNNDDDDGDSTVTQPSHVKQKRKTRKRGFIGHTIWTKMWKQSFWFALTFASELLNGFHKARTKNAQIWNEIERALPASLTQISIHLCCCATQKTVEGLLSTTHKHICSTQSKWKRNLVYKKQNVSTRLCRQVIPAGFTGSALPKMPHSKCNCLGNRIKFQQMK